MPMVISRLAGKVLIQSVHRSIHDSMTRCDVVKRRSNEVQLALAALTFAGEVLRSLGAPPRWVEQRLAFSLHISPHDGQCFSQMRRLHLSYDNVLDAS